MSITVPIVAADGAQSTISLPDPPVIATTFTIGHTALGPTTDSGNGNTVLTQLVDLPQAGTLQSLSFYIVNPVGQMYLGMYDSNNQIVASTGVFTPVAGWNTHQVITPVTLPAGSYKLAYEPSSDALSFLVDNTQGTFALQPHPFGDLPAVFNQTAGATGEWSFYATLTTSANQPPPPPPPPLGGVLPVDIPATSSRKAFAHYVSWSPISYDNLDGTGGQVIANVGVGQDLIGTQFLNPNGDNGSHAAYGGYWRDRPLGRKPLAGDWKAQDLTTEVRQAKSVGLDGFTVDIADSVGQLQVCQNLANTAASEGSFGIIPMIDMSGGDYPGMTNAQVVSNLLNLMRSPGIFKLSDGRVVLSSFEAEAKTAAWWQQTLSSFASNGVNVAFVPCFLSGDPSILAGYASVCYGFGYWGPRTPTNVSSAMANQAHSLGRIWMQPIAYQDNRPHNGLFAESGNGETCRALWNVAINSGSEWVQWCTWNDHAETTGNQPSLMHGWNILDSHAYQLAQWKTGAQPTVIRDAIYVSHRIQPWQARPTYPETELMAVWSGQSEPARDLVEVVVFATAPDTLTIRVGSTTTTKSVPAGMSVWQVPLATGTVSASLSSSSVTSPYQITNSPYRQDEQYVLAGSLR